MRLGQMGRTLFLGLFVISTAVTVAKSEDLSFIVEGYAFNGENLRPLENVTVRFFQTLANGSYIESPTVTDANGSYVLSGMANLDGVQLVIMGSCRTSRGRVGSQSVVRSDRGAIAGATYQKNLYIKLPRGVSRCLGE